ncbi:MAG: hypothetical protein ACR2FM_00545 [Candidatus Saccharimonadales bacterium]
MTPKPKTTKTLKKPRVRETPKYRSFRLSKKRLKQHQPIPGTIKLFKDSLRVIGRNKRLFIGISLINTLLALVFVHGLGSSFDIVGVKQELQDYLGNESDQYGTTLALFGYLIGTAGSTAGDAASAYQIFLMVVTSLAAIWAVRQILAGLRPGLRESFYKGMYPLIPFMAVLAVIGLQLTPFLFGNFIFTEVLQNGIAETTLEKALWFILFILLTLLSAYMLISSVFALYISTLPEMTPWRALRSARELVLHRRFAIALRIVAFPLVVSLATALIFIPLLIVFTPVVQILFIALSAFTLIFIHIYMYLLYRALI